MDYRQAWAYLDQLQFFKIKLGLESMNRLLVRFGNPHAGLSCIHIGGTNGKGSVAATLLAILAAAGFRVGLYTSPHLSSVRERFRINDSVISKEDFALLATEIRDILGESRITYFEFTTILALLWFARENVDLAILEVGMGGRLDATNVVHPLVSVITNVSMDHEQYLGTTLEEIAEEKAGIIKAAVPVVTGVKDDVSRTVVLRKCQKLDSPCFLLGRDFQASAAGGVGLEWHYRGLDGRTLSNLPRTLAGEHQVQNSGLALAVVDLLARMHCSGIAENDIRAGLARTAWPGRLEYFTLPSRGSEQPLRYLLDGAHNPAGVAALCSALRHSFPHRRLILIWGAMADKDVGTTLSQVAPLADMIIFTRPESQRSATVEELEAQLSPHLGCRVWKKDRVADALAVAAEQASADDLICVAGSLYLVGVARHLLLEETEER